MTVAALVVLAVLGSGVIAGVLVSVARAVVPTFAALPGDRYVEIHQLMDPRFDPLMPWISRGTLAAALAVIVLAPAPGRFLFAAGTALTGLVALVSELRNVRINRQVQSWKAADPPAEWERLRASWGRANLLRTVLALGAFVAFAIGAVVIS